MYPLLSTYSVDLDYLLLHEALREGLIEVVEVSKEGSVRELKVTNKSARMLLILDSEELVGAKQNRIMNTTILIQENCTLFIPVSCVEQGRWAYRSPRFSSEQRLMYPSLRAMKSEQVNVSLRSYGQYRSDQSALWEEISEKAERRKAGSCSMAMAEICEKEKPSIKEYSSHFKSIDSQIGAVFIIDGKVVGMDCLGRSYSFSKIFGKLVGSYALDAIDWFDNKKGNKEADGSVIEFIKAVQKAQFEEHPSAGPGTDLRIEANNAIGLSLLVNEKVIHLRAFAKTSGQGSREQSSRIARASQRRRWDHL